MNLGIITARNNSKGIPGKNMIDLGDKPLIEHTFIAAAESQRLDRVILTTDIDAAIELAKTEYPKIEAPFKRAPQLSTDEASQADVVLDVLNHLERQEGVAPDYFVLLQPTAPFRTSLEIDNSIDYFEKNNGNSLIGVTEVLHHPADYIIRSGGPTNEISYPFRKEEWQRRQDFPKVFFNTGSIYITATHLLTDEGKFYDENSLLFELSEPNLIDIDTQFDLELARGYFDTIGNRTR